MEEILQYLARVDGYLKSNDFILKQLLSGQAQMLSKIEELEKKLSTQVVAPVQITSSQAPPMEAKRSNGARRKLDVEVVDSTLESRVKAEVAATTDAPAMEKDPRFFSVGEPKYSVSQRVVNNESRNLYLADVVIEQNGTVIEKVRTKSTGLWMTALAKGRYTVTISKSDPQQMYELKQEFNMPDQVYELPMAVISPKPKK